MPRDEHDPGHVLSRTTYVLIFVVLLILTVVTYLVSRIELGVWNTPVALGIATVKMSLVALFFMHVIHSTRVTWLVIGASAIWLSLLLGGTLADAMTRGNVEIINFPH